MLQDVQTVSCFIFIYQAVNILFSANCNFVMIIMKYNYAFSNNKMVQPYAKYVAFVQFLNIDDRPDATWLSQLFEIETIDCDN